MKERLVTTAKVVAYVILFLLGLVALAFDPYAFTIGP